MHTTICEYCGSSNVIGHGNYKDRKRYKCLNCNKTFNDLTGTPVSKIREPAKFKKYVQYFNAGMSIRETAKKLKISLRTSFLWRKRIMSGLENIEYSQPLGDIGVASINFPRSEKGNKNIKGRKPRKRGTREVEAIPVIIFTDNEFNFVIEVADNKSSELNDLETILKNRSLQNLRITYYSDLPHHIKKKISVIQKARTDETVKAEELINSLNTWMKKFTGGVSTKYLKGYLNWFRVYHYNKNGKEFFLKLICLSKKTTTIIKK